MNLNRTLDHTIHEESIQKIELENSKKKLEISPSSNSLNTNFYLAIEQLHHIPLAVKL